ncbi:MAG TPA: SGNH/GDSL hydrolase family protein [Ktedonobacterales bacterium]
MRSGALAALLALVVLFAGCAGRSASSAPPVERPARPTLTYVAIGASDAFGIGTDDPDREAWPTDLAAQLGTGVHLINLGIPGATVASALQTELPIALDSHPNDVTVWLAVNDFADGVALDTYQAQLAQLLDALRAGLPHARIAVGNIPDLTLVPRFWYADPGPLRAAVQAWNRAIAADCAAAHVTLVDLYGGWQELSQHPEYFSSDGFHPSAVGAERLAQLFAAALRTS